MEKLWNYANPRWTSWNERQRSEKNQSVVSNAPHKQSQIQFVVMLLFFFGIVDDIDDNVQRNWFDVRAMVCECVTSSAFYTVKLSTWSMRAGKQNQAAVWFIWFSSCRIGFIKKYIYRPSSEPYANLIWLNELFKYKFGIQTMRFEFGRFIELVAFSDIERTTYQRRLIAHCVSLLGNCRLFSTQKISFRRVSSFTQPISTQPGTEDKAASKRQTFDWYGSLPIQFDYWLLTLTQSIVERVTIFEYRLKPIHTHTHDMIFRS